VTDAMVMDRVRDLAWTVDVEGELAGVRRLTPEGLYGRRKMTKFVQRSLPDASPGSVDRAMKALGLKGIRRAKGVRTTIPGKDGKRAGDLLNRDFTAAAPNRTWVMDFTYCRTWAGFAYLAFVVDVFAQKIVAWNCATSKDVELVMTPLRMATWQREREGRPVMPGELIGHADAGSIHVDSLHRAPRPRGHPAFDRVGRRRVRQRLDGVRDRPVQDRVHPHHGLPRRAVPRPG